MKKAIPIILFFIISFTIYECSISDEKSANVMVSYVSYTATKSETALIIIEGQMKSLHHGEQETWHISWIS